MKVRYLFLFLPQPICLTTESQKKQLSAKTDFEQGLKYFAQKDGLAEAKECFEKVLTINPLDKTAQLYLQRIQILTEQGLPDNWNGVWTFTEK